MEGPGTTLAPIAILALIVAIHEMGHFFAARYQGIHVSKFSIGFGPALFTYQGKDVEYSLRLIPIGGYVAFPDDEPPPPPPVSSSDPKAEEPPPAKIESGPPKRQYDPEDPGGSLVPLFQMLRLTLCTSIWSDLLKNRSVGERAIVISAGVIANVVFAWLTLFIQAETVGKAYTTYQPGIRIPEVTLGSAAERAGLKNGDLVLEIDSFKIPAAPSQVGDAVMKIRASQGNPLSFRVQRDGTILSIPVTPDLTSDGEGRIGVQIFSNAIIDHEKAKDVGDAINISSEEFVRLTTTVTSGLTQIVTRFSQTAGQLSGPVAIVAAGADIARTDAAGLYQFCALVNINLAIVNMLPLPALDGGFMLLLLIEAIRGKKMDKAIEGGFMASGLLALTAAGATMVVRDISNLIK